MWGKEEGIGKRGGEYGELERGRCGVLLTWQW